MQLFLNKSEIVNGIGRALHAQEVCYLARETREKCLPLVAMKIIDRSFKLNGLGHLPSTK